MNPQFGQFQEAVHKNAVEKGFWQEDANIPEKLALVHAEVSEALEELRREEFNPDKFAEELADLIERFTKGSK